MSKLIYVISMNTEPRIKFDALRLFSNKQDSIDFLEGQGFKRDFNDFSDFYFLKNDDGIEIYARIRCYEAEKENK